MRVELFPADNGGCGHYRMIWPAEAAVAQGLVDAEVRFANEGEDFLPVAFQNDNWGKPHVVGLGKRDWPDLIIFQRPLNRLLADVIPFLQKAGVKVIVELDDDFANVSPKHSIYQQIQQRNSPDRNWHWLLVACDRADAITVSTKALRYYNPARSFVVPNYVPESYLKVERQAPSSVDGLTFGWSGSLDSHPNDLQVTRGGIARALGDASFQVIGPGHGVADALQIRRQLIATGLVPLSDYPNRAAEFNVMVAPLELTPFNQAKSYLKGLEAAAVGCGVIASPTDDYRELERLGLCRIAAKPAHWEGAVKAFRRELATDEAREQLAHDQRAMVRLHRLTVEERAHERVAIWRSVLEGKVASHE